MKFQSCGIFLGSDNRFLSLSLSWRESVFYLVQVSVGEVMMIVECQ